MTLPQVSVTIASYDKAPLLRRTLESIFRQRPPFSFEVLVVDDGSPTAAARDACAAFPVRYLRRERPPGFTNPSAARNAALRAARAPILVQQSDDVLHAEPNTLEALVAALRPGAFCIATVYDFHTESGLRGDQYTPRFQGEGDWRPLFFLGSCWREDVYKIGGYDEDFKTAGWDDDWHADCLMRGLGLTPSYVPVLGLHQAHPRPQHDWEISRALYHAKVAAGVFCAAGGPWEFVSG
jgi:glycosyltransferase involved in cell wall biosynthesis